MEARPIENSESGPGQAAKSSLGKQVIGGLFAILLLWLTFKDSNWQLILHYLKDVQPAYIVLLFVSGLLSHFLRAYRWIFLLQPLSDKKISLFNSFYAVMIGYAVNLAIPKGGEVARLVSICRTEKLPWAGVLPTMLIDRMLDLGLLVFLLGSCLLVLPKNLLHDMPWLVPTGVVALIGTVIGIAVLPSVGNILAWLLAKTFVKARLPQALWQKLNDLAGQFDAGTKALKSPVKYPIIAALSFAIWFCYWLNFYLMVLAFNLQGKIDPVKCLIVFTISSIGQLIPTPGSLGSFHYLASKSMTAVTDVPMEQAQAFATLLHFISFVLVVCLPALILVVFFRPSEKAGTTESKGDLSPDVK